MWCIYVATESSMTKAKLFMTGGSQAVRLPAEFRFEGDEVDIRRDSETGDVVLSKPIASWDEYFAAGGLCNPQRGDAGDIDSSLGMPEVIGALHVEPHAGRSAHGSC